MYAIRSYYGLGGTFLPEEEVPQFQPSGQGAGGYIQVGPDLVLRLPELSLLLENIHQLHPVFRIVRGIPDRPGNPLFRPGPVFPPDFQESPRNNFV